MQGIVRSAFRATAEVFSADQNLMPFDRWNESILRYHFCRSVATHDRHVEQFVECNRIDLVMVSGTERAFVEFKFYARPVRYDPYKGKPVGHKGGPGPKNLGEFRRCVDFLRQRKTAPGLSKFIVLLYGDPSSGRKSKWSYAADYREYRHTAPDVLVVRDAIDGIEASGTDVSLRLYEVLD